MKKIIILSFLLFTNSYGTYLEYHNPKDQSHALDPSFFQYLQSFFQTPILIESGTFRGTTVENAMPYFEKIYSIELSDQLYHDANEKFQKFPSVSILHGSSDIIIAKLLQNINSQKRILFWLDGHYSAGVTALGSKETPIVEELLAIKASGIDNAVILVDDIRCFFWKENDFPSVQRLKELILNINPAYQFYIYGDLAIAFLDSDNITVSPLINIMTDLYIFPNLSSIESNSLKIIQQKLGLFGCLDQFLNRN